MHFSSKKAIAASLVALATGASAGVLVGPARGAVGPATTTGLVTLPATASAPAITVIAQHLDQPKHLTLSLHNPKSPGVNVVVALSGNGIAPARCARVTVPACTNASGSVDLITQTGRTVNELRGVGSASLGGFALGPVESWFINGRFTTVASDFGLSARTGEDPYGSAHLLGDLYSYHDGDSRLRVLARFGPYQAFTAMPRVSPATAVAYGASAVQTDPSAVVPYRGGWAVADAGAGNVLWVSPRGRISTLATLPTLAEVALPGSFGLTQRARIVAQAEPGPSSITVGPDGALYVGERGGVPNDPRSCDIYRIVPGHRPTIYARGLTAVEDIAFTQSGTLLALEFDRLGFNDPGGRSGHPQSGAIVAINRRGVHRTLLASELPDATGMVLGPDHLVFVAVNGYSNDGKILRFRLPS